MEIFQDLHPICRVVRAVEKSVRFDESGGIGPWHDHPPLAQFTRLEAPDSQAFRQRVFKWANIRNMPLQLRQPGPGETPRRRFLEAHGDGVFHLGCRAEAAGVAGRLTVQARGRRNDTSGLTSFETPDAAVTLQIRATLKAS